MTTITRNKKSVAVNPLKQSPPLGAALAFLGLKGIVPLFHGSQGCTAFAKVLLVRHFREAIPLATTAMTEVTTILGGEENIEQAILTLVESAKPDLIGLLTTGLTETRGDDMDAILKSIRQRHPELDYLPIIFVSTPDYKGALQDGYAAAVNSIVATDYGTPVGAIRESPLQQVTILAGSLLSPGDVEEIKEIVEAFGLNPLVIPDLSGSVDGHLDDDYNSKTPGGTSLSQLQQLERSLFTIAIGESMRLGAETLKQKFGTNYQILPRLTGLGAVDKFLWLLAQISSYKTNDNWQFLPQIPEKYQRQRRQLQDAILDTHFYLGGKKVSLALEPDLLYQTSWLLKEMGAEVHTGVTTTKSPILKELPCDKVTIGDLEDLEDIAPGSDLIITNSQGKSLADKLHIPLYRMGYPIYDRLGNGSRCLVGYRGTMQFLFDIGNIFIELGH
ncbi:Nitrogenase iron-molybdenum cofactor biosynthesis protein NifN [Hyella patelloides LEGE 07179]|uniref:Nitrogenase iron-molybdenum cofactor biosynthesis protein NifN n=2 Tax=Cyanophyceae TaxID=3028117 RepID=A0A563W146_9CYAN|nr:nitrogenase iron-molybdenum cofactor biosynthesis protein NifN [Hyella patelloides]VEP17357.1 Nitrogenase iron-molybdenum cofactor biosynthesis protein NifN [Hyella patelloides LEGE 07179]